MPTWKLENLLAVVEQDEYINFKHIVAKKRVTSLSKVYIMGCPMGFTVEDLERRIRNDAEKGIVDEKFPDVHIFDTIAEPREIRKMAKEIIYLTGGQYAILLQWLHPGLARGSVEHSDFNYQLRERLQTTSRFLNAAVFGTDLEKKAVFSIIHKKNAAVKGEDYYADDPELHRWTAATLFMSLKMVHEAFFWKLTRREEERLYKESAIYGTSLRMPTDWWPATLDDFYTYWNHNIETLPVTPWAHTLFKQLMYPEHIPIWMKPYSPVARLFTAQWLPERLQREYGLQNNKLQRGVYKALSGYVRLTYPLVPKKIRQRSHKVGMKDLREATKRIGATGTWADIKGHEMHSEKV